MVEGKKVIVFTPWGRELTASILFAHLKRDHEAGIVDEWHLWMNTDEDQQSDREYGYGLAEDNDWIKTLERPEGPVLHPKQMNTGRFYSYYEDTKDAVLVRMDDDIVWIEPNAIERLVKYRINHKHPFVAFPIIWNNAVCSYYLQQGEQLPSWWGVVGNHCMDAVGWRDAAFAQNIHNHLLDGIENGWVDKLFMHTTIQLQLGQQFSVSSFAQFSEAYENGVSGEEEAWHTIDKPYELNRANVIVPNSLISHFSFYHQRAYLLDHTNILDRYRELANDLHA